MTQQSSLSRFRPVIRVFVSSTFSDLKHERDALQREVFPRLEQFCASRQFQFQAIDLRWGISSEAGDDHRTMRICFDELRRSQEVSPEPNFLILLGNRYGTRPLPEEISQAEYEQLTAAAQFGGEHRGPIPGTHGKTALEVLRDWYRCDENVLLPVPAKTAPDRAQLNYVLQPRTQDLHDGRDYTRTKKQRTHSQDWRDVQQVLRHIIDVAFPVESLDHRFDDIDWPRHAARVSDRRNPGTMIPQIVRFQASATEQEIWHGALSAPNAERHVLAFFRDITNRDDFAPEEAKDFYDLTETTGFDEPAAKRQNALRTAIAERLGQDATVPVPYSCLKREGGKVVVDASEADTKTFCDAVFERFRLIIERQIDAYWRKTTPASADRAARDLEIEQREYKRFAAERGGEESFVGRHVELRAILDYVGNDSPWPLVIHGASGCGKTALVARASLEVAKTRERLDRFIGVTPRSSDLRSLLSSLCQELRERNPRPDAVPTEIKELRDEFSKHLAAATPEQPLILFLDALDQLADADNGRLLNWLPLGSLPAYVKLVASCLSDRAADDPAGQPYAELRRRPIPVENVINLDVLSEAEARLLLIDRWLPKAGRKVSDEQRAHIEQRLASPACRKPIYLKLLFEEVRLWHSYDPAPVLGESVPAVLGQFFDRLSQPTNHGPLLVNRVLGYLSASRHGLAENEILEILFADPEYRAKLNEAPAQTRYELPPNATRIPIALWSRLRYDLAPYLTERAAPGADVLTFYHRQVAEWVLEHFTKPSVHAWQPHQRLGDYFTSCCKPAGSHYLPQERAIGEVAYHYRICDNKERLREIYSNISYYCSYVKSHNAFVLKAEIQLVPDECIPDEIRLLIANAAALLAKYPEQAPSLMYKELAADNYRQQAESLAVRPWIRVDRIHMEREPETVGIGITPMKSTSMWIQASCVAENAGVVFLYNSANRIETLRMEDLKPCSEITLPDQGSRTISKLLCDPGGKLLALVYDNGQLEVLELIFAPSGAIFSNNCVHRDVCQTGKFGTSSACAWPDGIVYQTRNGDVIRLQIKYSGELISSNMASDRRLLISCYGCNIPHLIWRSDKDYSIDFPEIGGTVRMDFAALAICRHESRLAISTAEGKLSIYHWPALTLEKEFTCRLPVISISHHDRDLLLMTDRHGNILSLDHDLQLFDNGPCSRGRCDEYPSAIYPMETGAFYISNSKCATLALGAVAKRDVVGVDEIGEKRCILTYCREEGFAVIIGTKAPRPLIQSIVGQQYEFEFVKFKLAWNGNSSVAYTGTVNSVKVDNGLHSTCHAMESEVRAILHLEGTDSFLVLCDSGQLHLVTAEKSLLIPSQSARSETGNYLIANCGEYVCIVARNVLCKPTLGNVYSETVLTLHQISVSAHRASGELVELQHLDNNQQVPIDQLSYHAPSNSLYLYRRGILERWLLDEPRDHAVTSSALPNDFAAHEFVCAYENGIFYIDVRNQLRYHPTTLERRGAELASFRTITFLSPAMKKCGYFVEDNHHLFRFAIEE